MRSIIPLFSFSSLPKHRESTFEKSFFSKEYIYENRTINNNSSFFNKPTNYVNHNNENNNNNKRLFDDTASLKNNKKSTFS